MNMLMISLISLFGVGLLGTMVAITGYLATSNKLEPIRIKKD
ncbi:hypothetical protein [Enterococcus timonensis]|nr:hypothetical protein [Enterococcus timonensis]